MIYEKSQHEETNYVSVNTLIQPKKRSKISIFDPLPGPIQKSENKTGLPDHLKGGIENLSGMSLDDVQVNYNSAKPAQLQALAYTQGADIHVAPGQERHLPHEAWHVVQQKQGRVQPMFQMKGIGVNDDPGLEREADVFGQKANNIKQESSPDPSRVLLSMNHSANTSPAQCVKIKKDGYQIDTDDADPIIINKIKEMVGMGREDLIQEFSREILEPDKKRFAELVAQGIAEADKVQPLSIKNKPHLFKLREFLGKLPRSRFPKNYEVQPIKIHEGSAEVFRAGKPGEAFTGIIIMNHKGQGSAKMFLHPVAPHDSYPTRERTGDVRTRIYGTAYEDLVTHQQGVNPSHEMLWGRIEDARSRKSGMEKNEQWESSEVESAEYRKIGFTVIKVSPGRHRFSFTSTSQNAASFKIAPFSLSNPKYSQYLKELFPKIESQQEYEEASKSLSRQLPKDWTQAIADAINAIPV